ncbi:unnamed protein product [Vitrella brassicaformis CCMP3155]|uniref:Uncharacterized protein n=1 Tax=Vitrella brassicaformis (strain CCMP3155) TaxID=1169540 RepID=A0A0G4GFQ8_VITBC|nr:unnamed protein product [Vitrella brassicaformis CCMP3155]|eukprot:CEM28348.1 unnamed protein product [Vitrella brassicaformis CCMP3155]
MRSSLVNVSSSDQLSPLNGAPAAAQDGAATDYEEAIRGAIRASDVPEEAVPLIAEYVGSYSQLEALVNAHSITFTQTGVLWDILARLLSIKIASFFGDLVQVPVPQLTQRVAATVATGAMVEQLRRRLFMLEYGGRWARWRPHLALLYHLQAGWCCVTSTSVCSTATRRPSLWRLRRLASGEYSATGWTLEGGRIRLRPQVLGPLSLQHSPSAIFTFDAASPPTHVQSGEEGWGSFEYRTYGCAVGFILTHWLTADPANDRPHMSWPISAEVTGVAAQRVQALLAAHPSIGLQGVLEVFDKKGLKGGEHMRMIVLGGGALGEQIATIELSQGGGESEWLVNVRTTEPCPYTNTRNGVISVLGFSP